jgi:hypothetical protein
VPDRAVYGSTCRNFADWPCHNSKSCCTSQVQAACSWRCYDHQAGATTSGGITTRRARGHVVACMQRQCYLMKRLYTLAQLLRYTSGPFQSSRVICCSHLASIRLQVHISHAWVDALDLSFDAVDLCSNCVDDLLSCTTRFMHGVCTTMFQTKSDFIPVNPHRQHLCPRYPKRTAALNILSCMSEAPHS